MRNHISAILQKLDLKNRAQLVVRYYPRPLNETGDRDKGTGAT